MLGLFNALGQVGPPRFSGEFPGLALFDSGVESSHDNYAMLSPRSLLSPGGEIGGRGEASLADAVKFGLDFFASSGRPHIWPLFDWVPERVCALLERDGLSRDEDFYAMTADAAPDEERGAEERGVVEGPLRSADSVFKWAFCAWHGFDSSGSDDPMPREYAEYAMSMARRDEICLAALRAAPSDDLAASPFAASGMLFTSGDTAGIYNISTLPEHRRRGLAMRMMRDLIRRAAGLGAGRAVLLATPFGRPLYLRCGFRDEGTVKIFTSDEHRAG
jgi:GNAT superfamily N-acetyltransferase